MPPSNVITSSPRFSPYFPVWTTGVRPLTMIASCSAVWLWPPMTTSMPGTALGRRTSSPSVKRPSLPFSMPPWLSAMITSTFSVSRRSFHHLPGGLDGIGELNRAGAVGIELRFFAEQPEDAKAHAAALDHEVAADHPILGQALETGQCRVIRREVGIRCDHRRNPAGLGGHRDGLGRAVRPEVEIMVAEGGGVATHPGQELQLAAGLAGGGGKRGPHAVVARIKHQHRTLILARLFPLRDQRGQTREPASGRVVVERERGVVRGRGHPDQVRMEVVGVQDGEGLLPVRCRRWHST